MAVGTYALTTLIKAKQSLGLSDADLQIASFYIYNNNSGAPAATAATVEITTLGIRLIVSGAGGGDDHDTTITFAAEPTIAELLAAIVALDKGWVVESLGSTTAASVDLQVKAITSAFLYTDRVYLTITNNELIEELINRATDLLENHCDRDLKARDYTADRYDGDGSDSLYLKTYPINSISKITTNLISVLGVRYTDSVGTVSNAHVRVHGNQLDLILDGVATELTFASYTTITLMAVAINAQSGWTGEAISGYGSKATSILLASEFGDALDTTYYCRIPDYSIGDFEIYSKRGMIKLNVNWFPEGNRNICIDHNSGYNPVPDSLEQICLGLVSYKYKMLGKDTALKSEKLGDYSYTMKDIDNALTNSQLDQLTFYVKFSVL